MDSWFKLLENINAALIQPSVFAVVIIGILSRFKKSSNLSSPIVLLQKLVLVYAILNSISLLISVGINPKESEYYQFFIRATGPYFIVFILNLIFQTVFPFLLFIKRLKGKFWITFFIALLSNSGWWFESLVIHITSIHRDYLTISSFNFFNLLPYPREIELILIGVFYGSILFFIYNRKTNSDIKEHEIIDH